jgi:hypothetical protein
MHTNTHGHEHAHTNTQTHSHKHKHTHTHTSTHTDVLLPPQPVTIHWVAAFSAASQPQRNLLQLSATCCISAQSIAMQCSLCNTAHPRIAAVIRLSCDRPQSAAAQLRAAMHCSRPSRLLRCALPAHAGGTASAPRNAFVSCRRAGACPAQRGVVRLTPTCPRPFRTALTAHARLAGLIPKDCACAATGPTSGLTTVSTQSTPVSTQSTPSRCPPGHLRRNTTVMQHPAQRTACCSPARCVATGCTLLRCRSLVASDLFIYIFMCCNRLRCRSLVASDPSQGAALCGAWHSGWGLASTYARPCL